MVSSRARNGAQLVWEDAEMRSIFLATLLLFASSDRVEAESADKAIMIINDTPYDITEIAIWPEGNGVIAIDAPYYGTENLFTPATIGSIEPLRGAYVYGSSEECVFNFAAETAFGRLFSGQIDTCTGPAVIIMSSIYRI
jgi:hypothetical protein